MSYKGRHRVGNTPKIVPVVEAVGDFDPWTAREIPVYTNIGNMVIHLEDNLTLFHLRGTTLTIEFDHELKLVT